MINTLLSTSLNIQESDKICIICDDSRAETAEAIKDCLKNKVRVERVKEKIKCDQLPKNIISILCDGIHNVIIICIEREQDIWHSKERKKAKYSLGKRLASVIAPYEFLEKNIIKCDLKLMKELGEFVKNYLRENSKVVITGKGGTSIEAIVGESFLEDGDYSIPNTGGDFPSGESGFSPKELTVNGMVNYDLKVQGIGCVNMGDITVEIKDDKIEKVFGRKTKEFNDMLEANNEFRHISEISFGINPYIEIIDNKTNIIEEKKAGTVHFGHGGNFAYGNKIGRHFDAVIDAPTVYIDNVLFIKNGKFHLHGLTEGTYKKLKMFDLVYNE